MLLVRHKRHSKTGTPEFPPSHFGLYIEEKLGVQLEFTPLNAVILQQKALQGSF